MIPQIAFDLLDTTQINRNWIGLGGGVEGHIFDGHDFLLDDCFDKIERSLKMVKSLNNPKLTLHFPTSNASYISNENMLANLLKLIDIAIKHEVKILTLHSNDFVKINDFNNYDIYRSRSNFITFFDRLDADLRGSDICIAVENMPIIGNKADEFDSIFVMPDSFQDFNKFSNIKITFDICHWLITYYTLKSISIVRKEPFTLDVMEFLNIQQIIHFHFGSFKNLVIPYSGGICMEGVKPCEGVPAEFVLAEIIKAIDQKYSNSTGIVFEVVEKCYKERINAFKTLEWFKSVLGG